MGASLLLVISCAGARSDAPASTNTTSTAFPTLDEKVAFLERYVAFRRHYLELEYGIFYQDNARGCVPGPSDWDISIVARVPPNELSAWGEGMTRVESQPPELIGLGSQLDTRGVGEWYEGPGKVVGLDRDAGLIVYRATSR